MNQKIFKSGEAAKILQVCTKTLGRWSRAGLIGHRVGDRSQWRYPAAELETFIRSGKRNAE